MDLVTNRQGAMVRSSFNRRKRPLCRSHCEHEGSGVLALVPWEVRGLSLYEASAIEHKACPPTMGGESPRLLPQASATLKSLPLGRSIRGEFPLRSHIRE